MSEGPLEGGDVWGPGRVPHGASPPSSGPTSLPAGPLEPDPRGWEALTQAEAERDAQVRAREPVETLATNLRKYAGRTTGYIYQDEVATLLAAADALDALAVAERERGQVREALQHVIGVLGPDAPEHGCDGCTAEIGEALRLARAALAEEPS